jgi:phage/plasmid-like protein (TIGR03299 family)
MAHNVETMAYAGETPWHGLGRPVSNDLTPDQMLKAAGLDWTVSKHPLYLKQDEDGFDLRKTTYTALLRDSDNSILTFVPDDWQPLQNKDAFQFFCEFVEAGEMEMHTAGSLQNGKRVWALAKTKEKFRLRFKGKGEDVIENYLLLHNPHDYGWSIGVDQTAVRVVCNNTLTMALQKASARMVKVSHSTKFDPEVVKEAMFAAHENMVEYRERAEFLVTKKYKKDLVKEYFGQLFPSVAKVEEGEEKKQHRNAVLAYETLETQPGAELGEGSWWQAYNAVTFLTDHRLGRTPETRLNKAWFGTGKTLKIKAMNLALEYAEKA